MCICRCDAHDRDVLYCESKCNRNYGIQVFLRLLHAEPNERCEIVEAGYFHFIKIKFFKSYRVIQY